MWFIGSAGAWVVKRLMGLGVSEARAGALAASSAFGPVVVLVALVAGGGLSWGAIKLHDGRVAERAVRVCVSENLIAGLHAESKAKADALKQREARDEERAKELVAAQAEAKKLGVENEKLRKIAGAGGDRSVFAADDCWLQRNCRDHGAGK